MKSKIFSLLIVLLASSSLCQESDPLASYEGGSCGNGCINCFKYGSLEVCLACRNSKHEMTTAINGKCTGTESPIANCDISFGWKDNQFCAKCKPGYGGEWDYEDGSGDKRQMMYFKSCKKIEIEGVLEAAWVTKPDKSVTIQHHGCKPGYQSEYISSLQARRCKIARGNYINDENCAVFLYSGNCGICKSPYTFDSEDRKCILPQNNVGLISAESLLFPIYNKYSTRCNIGIEDLKIENRIDTGLSYVYSNIFGFSRITSPTQTASFYIPGIANGYGWCRSETHGDVGDKLKSKFSYLIKGLGFIFFYILYCNNLN